MLTPALWGGESGLSGNRRRVCGRVPPTGFAVDRGLFEVVVCGVEVDKS